MIIESHTHTSGTGVSILLLLRVSASISPVVLWPCEPGKEQPGGVGGFGGLRGGFLLGGGGTLGETFFPLLQESVEGAA